MQSFNKSWTNFNEGAYGVVFFGPDGKATKVFRQRHDAPREHVEQVFLSELEAYEVAQSHPELQTLIPKFFGSTTVPCVIDAQGKDISSEFYLDLAYQMETIEGEFVKTGGLSTEITETTYQLFHSAGIRHICDASAVLQGNNIKKIIDFAMKEYVLEHQSL